MIFSAYLQKFLPYLTVLVYVLVATIGAFAGGLWAGVGLGYALILYFATAILDRRWPRPSRDFLGLALIALVIIAALNLMSVDPAQSWFDWTRLVTIFLPLALLSSPELKIRAAHANLFWIVAAAAVLGSFALGIELWLSAPVLHFAEGDHAVLTHYNRGFSYLIILALPILAALWTRPMPASRKKIQNIVQKIIPIALFIVILLFPAGLTESRAAKLALILALLTVTCAAMVPKFTYRGLQAIVVLSLGWPFIVQKCFLLFQDRLSHLPPSWRARVEIWDYMSYRIFEHPYVGWGLGASKLLDFKNPHGGLYQITTSAAPHPHNVVTQLWVELGLPGLFLGIVFALLTLRQASRLSKTLVPFAFGAWMAAFCLALVAYNFWTDSLFAAMALAGFAFALLDHQIKLREIQPLSEVNPSP